MFIAFLITTLVGFCTILGGTLAMITKGRNEKLLAFMFGLAGCVVLYISLTILLYGSRVLFLQSSVIKDSLCFSTFSFLVGLLFAVLVDNILSIKINLRHSLFYEPKEKERLYRIGMSTVLMSVFYGIPEGLTIFTSFFIDKEHLGIPVAFAIALYNIPKGMSIAMPMYYATNTEKKAIYYTFFPFVTKIISAIIAILLMNFFMKEEVLGILFALTAGIMFYVSVYGLLISSKYKDDIRVSIAGSTIGLIALLEIFHLFHESIF